MDVRQEMIILSTTPERFIQASEIGKYSPVRSAALVAKSHSSFPARPPAKYARFITRFKHAAASESEMPKRSTNRPANLPPHPHHKHGRQAKNPYDRPNKASTSQPSNGIAFNSTSFDQPTTAPSASSSENPAPNQRTTSISFPTTTTPPPPQQPSPCHDASPTSPATSPRRRSSIALLHSTTRAAARGAKALWGMATKIAKASVGEAPALVHFSPPEKTRRGSTYSEVDALYQNGY